MYLDNQVTGVLGQFEGLEGLLRVLVVTPDATAGGCVGIHDQVAGSVVTSRGANDIDETLGIVIDGLVRSLGCGLVVFGICRPCRIIPATVGIKHLIIALKEQLLAVVLEREGYLAPESLELQAIGRVIVSIGFDPVIARQLAIGVEAVGTGIVMHVDDAVETLVDDVIDNLLDAQHPLAIDFIIGIHVVVPGDGHTDSGEASLFHHVDELAGGLGLTPAGF